MQVEEKIASEKGKVKYVESMGLTIGQTLIRKDPWGGHCNRDNCMPCMTKEGRCTREGVIYLMTCLKCKETGQKVHYVGESARCGYDRGAEHWRALQKGDPESPLVEHNLEKHREEPSNFSMEILAVILRNITSQTTESVKIQMMGGECELLNRRGEWCQNLPSKLTV